MGNDRNRRTLALAIGASVCTVASGASLLSAEIRFTEVAADVGIGSNVYSSTSKHSLGVNWIDFDDDGWPDLFATNGFGLTAHLYRNLGDGTFEAADELLPALPNYDMSGSVFGDYDNDGDDDLYIYTDHENFFLLEPNLPDGPPNLLLRNLFVENGRRIVDGQPLFEEVAAAAGADIVLDAPLGAYPGLRAKAGGFFDYDRDGCLDLFVGHLVFQSGGDASNRDVLLRNLCDGTFTDATEVAGIYATDRPFDTSYRPALGMLSGHFNDDLWPDLYVINASPGVPGMHIPEGHIDRFLVNQGDGTFVERVHPNIGSDAQAGMGGDFADIDLDGDFDLYLSDLFTHPYELELDVGNPLYLGQGGGFTNNKARPARALGADSWGVNFFDADQDGDEDLLVVTFSDDGGLSVFYENDGTGRFVDISEQAGFLTFSGRGSATADYDGDGDLDVAVVNQDGPLQLFRNDTTEAGRWVQIKVRGTESNRSAIDTLVTLEAGGVEHRRQIKGGSSAHSQDTLTVHFGLGTAAVIDRLTIRWPSGAQREVFGLSVDRVYEVVEP